MCACAPDGPVNVIGNHARRSSPACAKYLPSAAFLNTHTSKPPACICYSATAADAGAAADPAVVASVDILCVLIVSTLIWALQFDTTFFKVLLLSRCPFLSCVTFFSFSACCVVASRSFLHFLFCWATKGAFRVVTHLILAKLWESTHVSTLHSLGLPPSSRYPSLAANSSVSFSSHLNQLVEGCSIASGPDHGSLNHVLPLSTISRAGKCFPVLSQCPIHPTTLFATSCHPQSNVFLSELR